MLQAMSSRTAAEILRGRIVSLLKSQKMSRSALSREIGVSPSWVTDVVKGRRVERVSLSKLDAMARALKTTVAELFTDRDPMRQGDPAKSDHPLIAGAPHDPSAREAYFREIIEAYDTISKRLIDATGPGGHPASQEIPTPPANPAGDVPRHRPSAGLRGKKARLKKRRR